MPRGTSVISKKLVHDLDPTYAASLHSRMGVKAGYRVLLVSVFIGFSEYLFHPPFPTMGVIVGYPLTYRLSIRACHLLWWRQRARQRASQREAEAQDLLRRLKSDAEHTYAASDSGLGQRVQRQTSEGAIQDRARMP